MILAAILFIFVGILMNVGGIIAGRQPESDKTPKPRTIRTTLVAIGVVDLVIGITIIAFQFRG